MKKILLLFSGLALHFSASAQNPVLYEDENIQLIDSVQATFDELVDSIFAHIDLSRVSHGYAYREKSANPGPDVQ